MSVNGLEKITEKILADARERAAEILVQAEADCRKITADYAARADDIRARLSSDAERRGEDMVARAKSAAAMKKRNLLLEQRSDLIDGVFVSAAEWVRSLQDEPYAELLAGLLASSVLELTETEAKNRVLYGEETEDGDVAESLEILLSKKDRDKVGKAVMEIAKKKLSGKVDTERLQTIVLAKETAEIDGGVILRAGEVEFNCSFAMLFSLLKRELEADVSRALFAPRGQNV